jgi:hypothetical protein
MSIGIILYLSKGVSARSRESVLSFRRAVAGSTRHLGNARSSFVSFMTACQTPISTSLATELFGDPLGLAPHQFRMAQDLCAECRDYHALWPYRRLSRMVLGIEGSADIVQTLLRQVTPPNGRILIAGSADAGMLAMTAHATRDLKPFIDVADRCPTPLATCRRYAAMQGLSFTPVQMDIRKSAPPQLYDVVYGDCVLQFMPRRDRVGFLRRLGRAMTERGTLIFVERLRTGREEGSRRRDHAFETLDALAALGIELPEDEASFRLRLDAIVTTRRERLDAGSERLESALVAAGFHVSALGGDEQQRTGILPNGESVTMEIVVASPARRIRGRKSGGAAAPPRPHQPVP